MADQLMSRISVHQALHGYNDGHRLITSSLALDASDARVMLVMSDLAGPGMKPSRSGYLTGYPLEKSGRYVLARTWPAPEMPRPGCVWTHSMIIENADLAQLKSARSLVDAFKRPAGMDSKFSFASSVDVLVEQQASAVEPLERIQSLLHALYIFPTKQIVMASDDPFEDEEFALAIWMQQWPRLRRSFGFCTLSGMDRSGKGVGLDLQFVPEGDRQLTAKFPNAVVADSNSLDSALLPLMADLVDPQASTLREFLRRTGGDVDGGRSAMASLCVLHQSLLGNNPPQLTSAVSALQSLDKDGRKQARSIRQLVARMAMKTLGNIDDEVFDFLLVTLEQSIDLIEQADLAVKIGLELWRRDPSRLYSALLSEGAVGKIASLTLLEMKPELIVAGLKNNKGLISSIAQKRPDILTLPAFWKMPEVDDQVAEYVPSEEAGPAARALLAAGRVGAAKSIIDMAEPADLAVALEAEETDQKALRVWLKILCGDLNKLASVFSSGFVTRRATIITIARQISPDDMPNDFGEDPWLIALRTSAGKLKDSDEDFLAAYLLNRALGRKSRSQAELLRYSFSRVYRGFEIQTFSFEAENLASERLIYNLWFGWDLCWRLIETVTDRFVDYQLDPVSFAHLSDNMTLACTLVDEAAETKKGRAYLRRLLISIGWARDGFLGSFLSYVERKINKK